VPQPEPATRACTGFLTSSGFPITFAAGERQYVAVSTGASLNTAKFTRLTKELGPSDGNNVFVFALPER